jgi:hypothetical protein
VTAWRRDDPTRLVQLSIGPRPQFVGPLGADVNSAVPASVITMLHGRSAVYGGIADAASLASTTTGGTPCDAVSGPSPAVFPAVRCTPARFTASFSGTVSPSPLALLVNTAQGSHTVSMAPQEVAGAALTFTHASCTTCTSGGFPPFAMPPLLFRPADALRAQLAVTVGPAVTMTLSVTNESSSPAEVRFPSAQQYEFVILSGTTGAPVWHWSADRAFALELGSRTLAPKETVTFSESWTPTARGSFLAVGALTSVSHRASATAFFTVP